LRSDAGAEVHGVVHRQRLQPQHRTDRECQAARQAHADESGGQAEQNAEDDQPQLRPQLEASAADEIDRRPAG